MITEEQLVNDFHALGLNSGDMVNVHSSMKTIGGHDIAGGPETVIRALLRAIGESGTLVMPVFTHPAEHVDLRTAPSRLGLISETFRRWPGVVRSNDATHSVAALGLQAEQIISGHEDLAPLDVNSPLHKLATAGGKILHLGTDLRSCSMLHAAESIAGVPYQHIGYPGYDRDMPYTGADGVERIQRLSLRPGDGNGFIKAMDLPAVQAACRSGITGAGVSYVFDAAALMDAVVAELRKHPRAMLCDKANCTVCSQRRLVPLQ